VASFVEEGLERHEHSGRPPQRRAEDLPRIHGDLPLKPVAERFSEEEGMVHPQRFEAAPMA
jgi:hypothetical protein